MDQSKVLPDSFFDSEEVKDYYMLLRKQMVKKQQLLFEDKHFNLSKDAVTRELITLLYMCLDMNPEDRSSIEQLLESPVFDSVRIKESEENARAKMPIDIKLDEIKEGPKEKEYSAKTLQKYIVKYVSKIQGKSRHN